jgi:hypothetical protein
MAAPAPAKQLDFFIGRCPPEIAALTRAVLKKLRARLPGAVELVYDKKNALVIGFGPNERPSDALLSVVVYPRWILIYFLQGVALADPNGLLQGVGKVGRHIRLTDAKTLDDPSIRELIDDAVELMETPFPPGQKAKIVIRQTRFGQVDRELSVSR